MSQLFYEIFLFFLLIILIIVVELDVRDVKSDEPLTCTLGISPKCFSHLYIRNKIIEKAVIIFLFSSSICVLPLEKKTLVQIKLFFVHFRDANNVVVIIIMQYWIDNKYIIRNNCKWVSWTVSNEILMKRVELSLFLVDETLIIIIVITKGVVIQRPSILYHWHWVTYNKDVSQLTIPNNLH